jgi:hypothetical protein
MRHRFAQLTAMSTMVLALTLSPYSRAQQEKQRAAEGDQNPTAGQKDQVSSQTETIRGVIAGVTAEGEVMFDYRNNRAVATDAAFLTVVGSPSKANADEANRPANAAAASNERGASNQRRHNVYIVWLTPKTKICEAARQAEKPVNQAETQNAEQKREVALDNLELGDHVEIQFALRDDSGSTNTAHQTEQMRRKHGRHRTLIGFATAVTILPAKDHDQAAAGGESKEKNPNQ